MSNKRKSLKVWFSEWGGSIVVALIFVALLISAIFGSLYYINLNITEYNVSNDDSLLDCNTGLLEHNFSSDNFSGYNGFWNCVQQGDYCSCNYVINNSCVDYFYTENTRVCVKYLYSNFSEVDFISKFAILNFEIIK